jgi:hypothetical protein
LLLPGGQVIAEKFGTPILAFDTVDAGGGIRFDEQDGLKDAHVSTTTACCYVGRPDFRWIIRKVCDKLMVGGTEHDGASVAKTPHRHVVKVTQEASNLSMGT